MSPGSSPTLRRAAGNRSTARTHPAEQGYEFPAEWSPHAATWISWPRPEGISFPGRYQECIDNVVEVIRAIARFEPVCINVPNADYEAIVRARLRVREVPTRRIRFHYIRTNECWTRDHGPAFVVRTRRGRSEAAVVDWDYNAWGGKYPPYDADDAVPMHVAEALGLPLFSPGIVMEGGAVDFNGAGTVLTTTSCLLNPNRNPHLSRRQIERYLKRFYGQQHVVWLGDGIAGDDTDGHIDDLARFVGPRTIVIGLTPDRADGNYKVLRENRQLLHEARDQDGLPFTVIELPMPRPLVFRGQRLPATYMNFYFVNGGLLVPTFNDRVNDAAALRILQQLLPRREVVGVDCRALIWGLGAMHCLTQQQPKWSTRRRATRRQPAYR